MLFGALLDLAIKSHRQNGSILIESALGRINKRHDVFNDV